MGGLGDSFEKGAPGPADLAGTPDFLGDHLKPPSVAVFLFVSQECRYPYKVVVRIINNLRGSAQTWQLIIAK